jgi:putative ABC transport system permease protein
MRKIFKLSFANIRKTKAHTVSILLMFIIAAMLLNLGLLVFVNFGGYFEKVTKELNSSDVFYLMPEGLYSDRVEEYVENNDDVKMLQRENPLWAAGTIPYNNDTRECVFLINDGDKNRNFSKWKFVGEHLAPDSMSIYVPYVMSIDGGYRLNDKFQVNFKDTVITFTIKGFTEDVFFSSLDTGVMGVYLPHDTYRKVVEKLGSKHNAALIFANLEKKNKDVENGIREIIREENPYIDANAPSTFLSLDMNVVKLSRSLMASGVSVMMIAFAAIIAAVCLIVVRFRIGNSIEEDMTKIGSLKAVGYTSRQIISSVVTQFSLIALIGSIAGISMSYLATPALSNVFAHQSGLMWVQGFDGAISSISLVVILFVVAIVSFMAARRINKLNPIVALRGGITTHSFRRNYMPLHKSKGSLPFVLAIKLMLQNMKQSIMIGVIFIVVSFASTFALVMFYNSVIDTKTFAETPGTELSDVIAVSNPIADKTALVESVKNLEGVRKVQYIDTTMIKSGNYEVAAFVMDDYSKKETNTVYEGRYPLHSNEVVVSGYLAKTLNKSIGDSITLKINDKEAEYIITGYSQGSYMGGLSIISIRRDGILKLDPDFKQQNLQIYLNKDVKSADFKVKLEELYGDSVVKTVDMDKEFQQGMGLYTGVVSKVGVTIMVVTILVVILVLYFVINSSVIRKKHELGIQKALGFTTLQLMNQLSLGFLPPVITGVLLGSLLGMTQTNGIMTLTQKAMGIMRANYIITPIWIALFGAGIVIVSYGFSMLITYRIRKISAYGLVSE